MCGYQNLIRYVGVIRFIFMFSNFYWLDFTQQNMCCISKIHNETSTKTRNKNQAFLDFIMFIESACLLHA